mgnify:CR=1 FL=1
MPDEADFVEKLIAGWPVKEQEPAESIHIIFGHEVCQNCGAEYYPVYSVYSQRGNDLRIIGNVTDKQRPSGTVYKTMVEEAIVEFCHACHKDYLERALLYTK